MEKGSIVTKATYLWMLLDCEDEWPCLSQRVIDTQCKHNQYCMFYDLICTSPLYEGCPCSLLWPSGKVLLLMAVYSAARAWIFTGRTKRHCTSTSHKYLFSTFLPASAFIYWLFSNFLCLSRNRRHTNRTQRVSQENKRKMVFEWTFSCLLLHSIRATFTHSPGSQSQLWAFSIWRNADRRME